jgi:hypothetical protein
MPPLPSTQVSAPISDAPSSELDHLRALRDLPAEVIVPPQVVVSLTTATKLAARLAKPRKPTPAMRALFAKK